jgi:hypothetical protein
MHASQGSRNIIRRTLIFDPGEWREGRSKHSVARPPEMVGPTMWASRSRLNFRKILDCLRVDLNPGRKHEPGLRTLHKQNAHVRLHSPAQPNLRQNRTIGESDHHKPREPCAEDGFKFVIRQSKNREGPDDRHRARRDGLPGTTRSRVDPVHSIPDRPARVWCIVKPTRWKPPRPQPRGCACGAGAARGSVSRGRPSVPAPNPQHAPRSFRT